MEIKHRIFYQANPNNPNKGEYKVKLLNDEIVGVGDKVLIKIGNRNYTGTIKQTAGFGLKWDIETISIMFPGKKNGKMIHITNILSKC